MRDDKKDNRGGARPGTGPKKTEDPRKPRSFYASDQEWNQIKKNAIKAGIQTSEYIRKRALSELEDINE